MIELRSEFVYEGAIQDSRFKMVSWSEFVYEGAIPGMMVDVRARRCSAPQIVD